MKEKEREWNSIINNNGLQLTNNKPKQNVELIKKFNCNRRNFTAIFRLNWGCRAVLCDGVLLLILFSFYLHCTHAFVLLYTFNNIIELFSVSINLLNSSFTTPKLSEKNMRQLLPLLVKPQTGRSRNIFQIQQEK